MSNNRQFDQNDSDVLNEILRHRRDVRGNRFLNKELSEDTVQRILDAALHAPSVGFSQPWEFVLVRNSETRQAIAASFSEENDKALELFRNDADGSGKSDQYARLKLEGITESPLNIAVFYNPSRGPVLGQTSMPETGRYSVVCAIQNMWLMARSLNVGMGWVSILDPQKVSRILNAPADRELVAYLCLGYVDRFYDQPELEMLEWEARKKREQVIISEEYPA